MFADSLLQAEQLHLFRLGVWAAGSVIVGTLIFVVLARRRPATAILRHFAAQMTGWGLLELAYAALSWPHLGLRDVAGATRLDRLLWLNLGLDLGLVAVGATLALVGWRAGRRLGFVGAGIGVIVQATALFLINARLAALISR
ncbi:MAG TPA: hypothetical protein VFT41_03830 [Gemmatimonadaceae bacterium]|nr:hypothetical protein [Gemmatimonadaceae bacterium]